MGTGDLEHALVFRRLFPPLDRGWEGVRPRLTCSSRDSGEGALGGWGVEEEGSF